MAIAFDVFLALVEPNLNKIVNKDLVMSVHLPGID